MQAIITADFHLRADRPRCRTDEDWVATQEVVLAYISQEASRRKCPILIVGDLYDTPTVPDRIKLMFLKFVAMSGRVGFMPGNHDLLYHNTDNIDSSSIGLSWQLASMGTDFLDSLSSWGCWKPFDAGEAKDSRNPKGQNILFLHQLTFPSAKDLPPNVEAATAGELLAEYPDKNWIFTGDMHKSFHYEKKGRHVVNPGCITRQVADMKDYQPIVYYVDTEAELVEEIALPDTAELVDDSYLRSEEAREDRISAFIEQVKSSGAFSLSFVDNITTALEAHPELDEATVKTIHELMETN